MKSKAIGCGSISTVFSSTVLLCVRSIIINNNNNNNNSNDKNENDNSDNSNNNKNDNNSNNINNNSKILLMGCKNTSPIVPVYRKRRLTGNSNRHLTS